MNKKKLLLLLLPLLGYIIKQIACNNRDTEDG